MQTYEVAVIYHPGLEVDLDKAEKVIKKIFKDHQAELKKVENWGKQKLAYKIKGHEFGIYIFYLVEMPSQNVAKLDQLLNITDEVIRHLITKPDLEAKAKAKALQEEKDERNAKYQQEKDQLEASKSTEKEVLNS